MVTLLLVPRLRASFRPTVWQAQEHPYLSIRASGSNGPCSVPGLQGDQPRLYAISPFLKPTPLALSGGQTSSALGWVERQMWRLVQEQELGQLESPWWAVRATATLRLHHRQALEQLSLSWSSADNCCTHMHSQDQKTLQWELCNTHPWRQTEGFRDPSSTHPFNSWKGLFWSQSSAYIP